MDATDPPQPPAARPSYALLPAVGSALLAIVLFAVTLSGTYVYDDRPIVHDDARLRSAGRWGQLWTTDYFNGGLDNLYRPLTSSSYALQWWLHGDRPWAFHAVNVLLHAAVAAAVAELARRWTGLTSAAWAAGLLFAAHPVHAEAVANIVGRAELLCTLALLGSLLALKRHPPTALACGVVALLSKEQGLLAPLLWGLALAAPSHGRPARAPSVGETPMRRATVRTFALATLWLWAGYLLAREHFLKFDWDRGLLDRAMQPMALSTGVDRLLLPVALLGRYGALLAWPARLSPDYGGDVIGPAWHAADPYFWIGVAVIAAIAIAAVAGRRSPVTLFCLGAMVVTYAPVANAATIIGTIFNERLIYLPSAFVAVLAAAALAKLRAVPRVTLLAVLLVPMCAQTIRSAAEWSHPRDLFARALADHPCSIQLHLLLAEADHDAGRTAEQRAVLDDACRRFPDYWRCWADRARADADAGNFAAAEADLRTAIARAFSPNLQSARSYVADRERAAGWRPSP